MKKTVYSLLLVFLLSGLSSCMETNKADVTAASTISGYGGDMIQLPEPRLESSISLEETLHNRRSIREYSNVPLKLEDVSQLLWATQGITSDTGFRTAPSAGALYPLNIYLVAGNVENLGAGIYKYNPQGHQLISLSNGDARDSMTEASLGQTAVNHGAVDIVISAIYERTSQKYGERGIRYVHIEAGHAAQNLCLQATALDLGAVTIGAFEDSKIRIILGMSEDESPLYIIPVGNKKIS